MDHESPEWIQKNALKMLSGTRGLSGGGRGRRKQTEVLSGMILWNVLVLVLLVLAVCVQGQGGAVSSDTSSHLARRWPAHSEAKKREIGSSDEAKHTDGLSPEDNASQPSKDSQLTPNSSEESSESVAGGGNTQLVPESKAGSANVTTKDDAEGGSLPSHLPNMSTEAVLRGFYVFVGIGAIILIYIVVKLARLRKRRAPGKYRVLSHTDDQEMFPLAAGEGEDEEIFNAAHHQPRK